MVYVTALLPLQQGVAIYASLKRAADTNPDGRPRGRAMTDTMYERPHRALGAEPVPINRQRGAVRRGPARRLRRHRGGAGSRADPGRGGRRMITDAIDAKGRVALRRCTPRRPPARWWRWTRAPGPSPPAWPSSSGFATSSAEPRSAMRRFATSTMPNRTATTAPPMPATGAAPANGATTSRNSRAGGSAPTSTPAAGTSPSTSPRPGPPTGRRHRRSPAGYGCSRAMSTSCGHRAA